VKSFIQPQDRPRTDLEAGREAMPNKATRRKGEWFLELAGSLRLTPSELAADIMDFFKGSANPGITEAGIRDWRKKAENKLGQELPTGRIARVLQRYIDHLLASPCEEATQAALSAFRQKLVERQPLSAYSYEGLTFISDELHKLAQQDRHLPHRQNAYLGDYRMIRRSATTACYFEELVRIRGMGQRSENLCEVKVNGNARLLYEGMTIFSRGVLTCIFFAPNDPQPLTFRVIKVCCPLGGSSFESYSGLILGVDGFDECPAAMPVVLQPITDASEISLLSKHRLNDNAVANHFIREIREGDASFERYQRLGLDEFITAQPRRLAMSPRHIGPRNGKVTI
jgi:hypothetical protein